MAGAGGPGSRVVFTFGEVSFYPGSARERARRAGFRDCSEFGSDALWPRYLPGDRPPEAPSVRLGVAIM